MQFSKTALVASFALALAFILSCSGDDGKNGTSCTVQPKATGGYDVFCDGVNVGKLSNGEPGPIGPQGLKGDKGEKGDKGDPGTNGKDGTDGKDGINGKDGDKGDTGATGAQGATGDTGATGAQGATGATGAQGEKGDKGDTGATGADGKDGAGVTLKGTVTTRSNLPCYNTTTCTNPPSQGDLYIVTNNGQNNAYKAGDGFLYNGQTWQNIGPITGPAGATGETGAQGPAGPTGATGATGATGPAGATGETGAQGPAGERGTEGPEGPQGPVGPQGTHGTGINFKGSKPNPNSLPTCDSQIHGDLWIMEHSGYDHNENPYEQGDGYVCSSNNKWDNVGPIQGPAGPEGPQGAAGASCTATSIEVGFLITCGGEEKGILSHGTNGLGCSIVTNLENPAYYSINCGGYIQNDWWMAKAWCGTEAYDPATHFCENIALEIVRELKSNLEVEGTFTPITLGLNPGRDISELNFNWYSKIADGNYSKSYVRVFKGKYLVSEIDDGTVGSAGTNYQWHKATVIGLEPNTEYTYSVSNDSNKWSEEYKYRTPPASGYFRFAAISDIQPQCGSSNTSQLPCSQNTNNNGNFDKEIALWKQTVNRISMAGASLIVNAGDHAQYGNEIEYDGYFSPPELRSIPTAPVMGNHDAGVSTRVINFDYHFNLPNIQGKITPVASGGTDQYHGNSNYYFLYNKVLFIGLNTSPYPGDSLAAVKYMNDFSNTINAAKNAHTSIQYDFIVVTHHKSTNAMGSGHTLESDVLAYVKAGLLDTMTAKGVDLVITGHDHIYVRSKLMYNKNTSTNGTGTYYMTLKPGGGTSGRATGGFASATVNSVDYSAIYPWLTQVKDDKYYPEFYEKHSTYTVGNPGYTIIEVNGTRMNINVYESNGSLFETYTLTPTLPKF